ncbi:MAG: hypothetical protein ACI9U2_004797 [Bradymonadia bacterium]|jgi:hypothetical protein
MGSLGDRLPRHDEGGTAGAEDATAGWTPWWRGWEWAILHGETVSESGLFAVGARLDEGRYLGNDSAHSAQDSLGDLRQFSVELLRRNA